jgi:Na+-translocating ferredoxin:NAD+ oxidoreductase RnfD subunit
MSREDRERLAAYAKGVGGGASETSWPPAEPPYSVFVVSFDIQVTARTPEQAVQFAHQLATANFASAIKPIAGVVDQINHTASLVDINTVEGL